MRTLKDEDGDMNGIKTAFKGAAATGENVEKAPQEDAGHR